MSDFAGDWPSSISPWDKAQYFQPGRAALFTGPSGPRQVILEADPNRVAVWVRLSALVAASNPLVKVRYPGGFDDIVVQEAFANSTDIFDTIGYYTWFTHGPAVQGEWVWNTANADQVEIFGLVMLKWPVREQPPTIKVPKCPSLVLPSKTGS